MVLSTVLEIIGIGLVVPVIALMAKPAFLEHNSILGEVINRLGYPNQFQLIMGSMAILIGFHLIKTIFMSYIVWEQKKFVYEVMAELSYRLFYCYMHQPWAFHLQHNSAQLIQNITSETSVLITNALLPGMLLISETLVLLGIAVFLWVAQPVGTSIIVATVFATSWIYYRFIRKYISSWGETRQKHVALSFQHLQQGLGGVKDAILLGREPEFLRQFKLHNDLTAQCNQWQQTLIELPRLWLELFAVIGLGILVFVMLSKNNAPDNLVPILGLFAAAAFRIMPSINRILGAVQSLRFGVPVINTLKKEVESIVAEKITDNKVLLPFTSEITLHHIYFHYDAASTNSLTNINIRIPQGTSIGIVGSSGAGKSTLVDIILGLLIPYKGQVKVDGINIYDNIREWQNQIGYVPQSIFLTDDTLRRNVAFGIPDELIDETSVERAIRAAQLQNFIAGLPQGLDTLVGERGVRLSGGQRQRIGMARALYHDPLVLVLDEATSALDTATEKEVMEAVYELHGNKTLVIVAHRLSTVANCDYLYRIENGEIVEEGSFEQVTALHQSYEYKFAELG